MMDTEPETNAHDIDALLAEDDEYDEDGRVVLPGINDLPEFAGPEARKIHKDNIENEEIIEKTNEDTYEMRNRIKVMADHLRNVQQEVDHTNSLSGAKHAEIQTEGHLRQLTSRSLGRCQTDSKKLQADIAFNQEQVNSTQALIYKKNELLEEFKLQMNWNQEELEQWAVASKQKEDDNLAIDKYTRSDETKIKELTLLIEHLNKEFILQQSKLTSETTETLAKQMELDRIAIEFKNAHLERQTLVGRWQDTIAEIKKRDKEINEIGERFALAKSERTKKESILLLQKKRLITQQNENKEVEMKSESFSRIVLRKREEMMINSNKLIEFKSELESLKNELTTSAENLITKRLNNTNNSNLLEEKKINLERERQKYSIIKNKIDSAKSNTIKAEIKAKIAEEELINKEKQLNNELIKNKNLKEKYLKENNLVHELKINENLLKTEISGNKSIMKNLEGQLNQLDREAARQQELLYNAEFQIQQIERKINRGLGERSDEEKIKLKKQIEINEEILLQNKERKKILQQQTRKLLMELTSINMKKNDLLNKKSKFIELINEKNLENKMTEEVNKKDSKLLEEISVNNDLLLLEVKRLKDLLSIKSDTVYSLENRKQQLLLSLEERKNEIILHSNLLKTELRSLNEDKHNIIIELNNKKLNIEKLKSRFLSLNSNNDNNGGEKHTQAYYIIKAAQKREELQRLGDQLDQNIKISEKEIRALQITLEHLNIRNIAYRESFQKVELNGTDIDILKQLNERIKNTKDLLFRKKKELQRLITDYDEDCRRLEQVKFQCEKISKQQGSLNTAKEQVSYILYIYVVVVYVYVVVVYV